MQDKVKKVFDIAVKYFPGPSNNPSLRYRRKELCRDIIAATFSPKQVEEANKILLKVDE